MPEVEQNHFAARFQKALEFAKGAEQMERDSEATALWEEKYDELVSFGDEKGAVGKLLSRARPQVLRLSCIYALLDSSDIVRREHLNAAFALWDYCADSVRYIFGQSTANGATEKILRALRSAESSGMTRTEINKALSGHVDSSEIEAALRALHQQGAAYLIAEKTGGRTTERWYVAA